MLYPVGGETHESEAIKFGGQAAMSRAFAEPLVAKYPIGARVDVYYDPHDPKNAVLELRRDNLVGKLVFTIVFVSLPSSWSCRRSPAKCYMPATGFRCSPSSFHSSPSWSQVSLSLCS